MSRIYLHRTILDQISTISIGIHERYEQKLIENQQSFSETVIQDLAAEICASIPQLADYIEQLPSYMDRELNDTEKRFTIQKYIPGQPLLSLSLTTATVELSAHFLYDPGPFRYTLPQLKHDDVPHPRPASLYHAYYQLCNLELIQSLPGHMMEWIHGRLRWIEEKGDPEDLGLMRALLQRSRERETEHRSPASSGDTSIYHTP